VEGLELLLTKLTTTNLYQVNIDLNEVSTNLLNGINLENAMGVVKLEEWKQVSNYWSESDPPLIEHLHVIVEIHPASE
jgi:hypothetical protein